MFERVNAPALLTLKPELEPIDTAPTFEAVDIGNSLAKIELVPTIKPSELNVKPLTVAALIALLIPNFPPLKLILLSKSVATIASAGKLLVDIFAPLNPLPKAVSSTAPGASSLVPTQSSDRFTFSIPSTATLKTPVDESIEKSGPTLTAPKAVELLIGRSVEGIKALTLVIKP